MPMLVIAGTTVKATEFQEGQPETNPGARGHAFDGSAIGVIRWTKRVWTATLVEVTMDELAAMRTATAQGAHVTCSGDLLGGSVTCRVTIQSVPYIRQRSTFRRVYNVRLEET